jgi:hypothetical protein
MKRIVTYTRTWTVEVEGTDEDWIRDTRADYVRHVGIPEEDIDTLPKLVEVMVNNKDVLSDASGVVSVRKESDNG